jgi:excisionase family DNA binding protein
VSDLARALLDELAGDPVALEQLAPLLDRLRPAAPADNGWLTARQAAEYLGLSVAALHRLTAARTIPFAQDAPGCKLWFKRSELDQWRQ